MLKKYSAQRPLAVLELSLRRQSSRRISMKQKPIDGAGCFTTRIIHLLILRGGMSRFLLNMAKRSLPRLTLRGVGLASKDAVC